MKTEMPGLSLQSVLLQPSANPSEESVVGRLPGTQQLLWGWMQNLGVLFTGTVSPLVCMFFSQLFAVFSLSPTHPVAQLLRRYKKFSLGTPRDILLDILRKLFPCRWLQLPRLWGSEMISHFLARIFPKIPVGQETVDNPRQRSLNCAQFWACLHVLRACRK